MADPASQTTGKRASDPRPNCCTCGRFIGRGASWAMMFSGFPPTPDHEVFRCASCNDRVGVLEPQDGMTAETAGMVS